MSDPGITIFIVFMVVGFVMRICFAAFGIFVVAVSGGMYNGQEYNDQIGLMCYPNFANHPLYGQPNDPFNDHQAGMIDIDGRQMQTQITDARADNITMMDDNSDPAFTNASLTQNHQDLQNMKEPMIAIAVVVFAGGILIIICIAAFGLCTVSGAVQNGQGHDIDAIDAMYEDNYGEPDDPFDHHEIGMIGIDGMPILVNANNSMFMDEGYEEFGLDEQMQAQIIGARRDTIAMMDDKSEPAFTLHSD